MAFLGMRGTGDWATDERPKSWRQGILYEYPNGATVITGITSKLADEKVRDAEFNWWTKSLPMQGGAATGIFTNAGLTVAYASGGVAGDTVYLKCSAATASEFRAGHEVLLRVANNLSVDVVTKAMSVVSNGANSYIACRLLEADDNGGAITLSSCDTLRIMGDVNPEFGPMPDAISYNPTKLNNFTQIQRTSLGISRTARETMLRTEDAYKELKREGLELHGIQLEKMFIWGVPSENIGANGKPERTTGGIIYFIKANAPENVVDFSRDSSFSGDTWLESGEEWLDNTLERVSRFGGQEKMVVAGSGALLGLNRLAKSSGQVQMRAMDAAYGLKVVEWVTPFQTFYIKTHPLFSYDSTTRNSMLIFEPRDLRYMYVTDTMFVPDDGRHGASRLDGVNEEWLTECGLEMHFPNRGAYLSGVGLNNIV